MLSVFACKHTLSVTVIQNAKAVLLPVNSPKVFPAPHPERLQNKPNETNTKQVCTESCSLTHSPGPCLWSVFLLAQLFLLLFPRVLAPKCLSASQGRGMQISQYFQQAKLELNVSLVAPVFYLTSLSEADYFHLALCNPWSVCGVKRPEADTKGEYFTPVRQIKRPWHVFSIPDLFHPD